MSTQRQGLIVIILLVFISLLFATIVGYYWLRGQNYKFINQRAQLLLEVNKIEGFDLQRIDLISQQKLTEQQRVEITSLQLQLQQSSKYQVIDLLLPQDALLTASEQEFKLDSTIAQRRGEFVAGLRSRVMTFNQLVSTHLYLRYFNISPLVIK